MKFFVAAEEGEDFVQAIRSYTAKRYEDRFPSSASEAKADMQDKKFTLYEVTVKRVPKKKGKRK